MRPQGTTTPLLTATLAPTEVPNSLRRTTFKYLLEMYMHFPSQIICPVDRIRVHVSETL